MFCCERDRLLDVYVAKVHLHSEATSALVAAAGMNRKIFEELLTECHQAGSNAKEASAALQRHCQDHACWIP